MQNRALVIALICAAVAAAAHFSYLKKKGEEFRKDFDPVAVVVARIEIPEGKQLDSSMLMLAPVPKKYRQPTALQRIASAEGQYAKAPILKGEQILDSKLAGPGETWVSLNIPEGMRACTLAINEITGVAGLIRPGNRVDVIGIFRIADPKTKSTSSIKAKTLLQNKYVLSVGRDYMLMSPMQQQSPGGRKGANFSTITLALNQKQCQDLALAQEIGSLSLALRYFYDEGKPAKGIKGYYSTPYSVSGLKEPLSYTGDTWQELRGGRSISAY